MGLLGAFLALFLGGSILLASPVHAAESGTWRTTGSLIYSLGDGQIATLLFDGKVLVIGGQSRQAEVYDPSIWIWKAAGYPVASRPNHTATLLTDGRDLVAGGLEPNSGVYLNSGEIFDPFERSLDVHRLTTSRSNHTATLLRNCQVLAVEGRNAGGSGGELKSAGLYQSQASLPILILLLEA